MNPGNPDRCSTAGREASVVPPIIVSDRRLESLSERRLVSIPHRGKYSGKKVILRALGIQPSTRLRCTK